MTTVHRGEHIYIYIYNSNFTIGFMILITTMWGPPVISWFITPVSIVISIINHSEIGVMFTNLAIERGPHIVWLTIGITRIHGGETHHQTSLAAPWVGMSWRIMDSHHQKTWKMLLQPWIIGIIGDYIINEAWTMDKLHQSEIRLRSSDLAVEPICKPWCWYLYHSLPTKLGDFVRVNVGKYSIHLDKL